MKAVIDWIFSAEASAHPLWWERKIKPLAKQTCSTDWQWAETNVDNYMATYTWYTSVILEYCEQQM